MKLHQLAAKGRSVLGKGLPQLLESVSGLFERMDVPSQLLFWDDHLGFESDKEAIFVVV